jgi:uncharacterized protein (TIGR00159 family)
MTINYLCNMILELFGFLQLSLVDVLDIIVVAIIIYFTYRWIRNTGVANIFFGLVLLFAIRFAVSAMGMRMMTSLLNAILDVGILALIIIFQQEIRHFLGRIGSDSGVMGRGTAFINRLLGVKEVIMDDTSVDEITEACRAMSAEKCGALIVIPHKVSMDYVITTGDRIDATVHRRLIRNLFFKNSPLHDGAMIISGNRIVAARCTLPMSDNPGIPPQFGMRHKAAIGISEETDAEVVVVSEETGNIEYIHAGVWTRITNINELKIKLSSSYRSGGDESQDTV